MCLAVPGIIVDKKLENGLEMGRVDFGGTVISVCLAYVPEAKVGQYVIVHAGFALNVIDEEEAAKTLALWKEINEADGAARE
jgi:hydrogenase expression/formation protein HypC